MSLKKGQKESKQYYRPVTILPDISKNYESVTLLGKYLFKISIRLWARSQRTLLPEIVIQK